MTARPFVLAETNYASVKELAFEVAVLPWGATEAHNYHLPYSTDNVESEAIAVEAARIAWDGGSRVIVLPCVPFGVNTGQLDVPLCINMNPSTQAALLRDVCKSLQGHGIQKLVIINGHGGNDFRQIIRELQGELAMLICQVNWYGALDPKTFFSEPGDHAGELETSLLQYLTPHLVRPLGEAGSGAARRFRIRALREGWAWTPRKWSEVTEDTGVGDPRAATPAKGAAYFTAVTQQIAGFFQELAAIDPKAIYD